MDFVTLISLVTLFYGAIYFTDQFLKSCMNIPYMYFLENVGLRLQPFQVHVFSTIFNRPVAKLAYNYKNFFRIWFSIGVIVVLLLLLPSIVLLVYNLIFHLGHEPSEKNKQILQPMVPGLNLPVEEFYYYFFTLLIASVIHEAGHAIAAAREDVHINGIGFFLVYALPGAYVDLSKDGIRKLSQFRQLKILCAGVWHNVVLAILAFGIGSSLPITMRPFYHLNQGVYVLSLDKNSPARGPKGLFPGDVIDGVNFCSVRDAGDWKNCLVQSAVRSQVGFCVPEKVVNSNDETIYHSYVHPDGSVECCHHSEGDGKLCFELQNEESVDIGEAPMQPYSCLPARVAVASSSASCTSSGQCLAEESFCLAPSIKNASRLEAISRSYVEDDAGKYVLYLGLPGALYYSVKVSNYVPKLVIFSPWLPYVLEVLCDYLVKFSGALGLMNLVPCVYLDGYWIARALVELALSRHLEVLGRRIIHIVISGVGTALLLVTVGLGAWDLL